MENTETYVLKNKPLPAGAVPIVERIANSDETSIDIQLAEQMLALLEQSFETMNNEANRDNVFNYISLVVYTIHTHIPIVTNISFSVA